VTLPLYDGAPRGGDSFAFMYSCEDASGGADGRGRLAGVGAQVMGPADGYFCRHARDTLPFWAWPHRLGLGHAFKRAPGAGARVRPGAAAAPAATRVR
jgi:tocopherol cyclase